MDISILARQALEEHEKLDREIELLKLRINAPYSSEPSEWMGRCTEHFRHFHTQLRKHIEMEEQGGFMKPVRERRPTMSTTIDKLLHEHRQMRDLCNEIEKNLETCKFPSASDMVNIRTKIDLLLLELSRHEASENKLVQQVFVQDIGAGD